MSTNDGSRKPFDLLSVFANFSLEKGMPINQASTIAEFVNSAKTALSDAQEDDALLHGQRAQAMFEAMLVSMGAFRLLKSEDNGRVHSDGSHIAPDFRIVLDDKEQWLVEVKNIYIPDPFQQSRRIMKKAYLEKLEKYSQATGGKLKLAVYWAKWHIWTLVSPDRFADGAILRTLFTSGDRFSPRRKLKTATLDLLKANELGRLGDRMIGSKPPLKFRLLADSAHPISEVTDGSVGFTIGDVQLFCGEEEINDPIEREIAWTLMLYGDWEVTDPEIVSEGGTTIGVEYQWWPSQRQKQGYEIIGTLSQIFTRHYSALTVEGQDVVQLHVPQRPGWLSPLVEPVHEVKSLPLWVFTLQASYTEGMVSSAC